jgi:hypothetical protein
LIGVINTARECAEAALGAVACVGRYEVKYENVHHTIDAALNPNLIGAMQLRHVTLNGDDLTLSASPDAQGNYLRLRWRRAAKM